MASSAKPPTIPPTIAPVFLALLLLGMSEMLERSGDVEATEAQGTLGPGDETVVIVPVELVVERMAVGRAR